MQSEPKGDTFFSRVVHILILHRASFHIFSRSNNLKYCPQLPPSLCSFSETVSEKQNQLVVKNELWGIFSGYDRDAGHFQSDAAAAPIRHLVSRGAKPADDFLTGFIFRSEENFETKKMC